VSSFLRAHQHIIGHSALTKSDHQSVMITPVVPLPKHNGRRIVKSRRSVDPNARAMLYDAISKINWCVLYRIESCDDMVNYFYPVLHNLLDYYLPVA